ncbi:MAG: PfkB family carbohydrate kinase [Pirellulaceae bacterium]
MDEQGNALQQPASKPDSLIDTVGAGDAFSAATIHGILSGWDDSKTLIDAASMASRVCQLRGAITNDRGFYQLAGKASS